MWKFFEVISMLKAQQAVHLASSSSEPLDQPTFAEINTGNQIMAGLPMLSSWQGEHVKDLKANQGLNNLASSFVHDVPSDALGAFVSSSCPNASSSSVATSLNCGYGGQLGDMNDDKWDLSKLFIQPEFTWKTGLQQMKFDVENDWLSHPYASSSDFKNKLSQSFSAFGPSVISGTNARQQFLDATSSSRRELSLGFGSPGNSALFSHITSRSKCLRTVQEILTEIAIYSLESIADQTSYSFLGFMGSGANFLFSSSYPDELSNGDGGFKAPMESSFRRHEDELKKSELLSLLQMVDDRHNQCLDEIHTITSAFHAATRLDPQIRTHFSIQTISILYKNLRERISSQILIMGTRADNGSAGEKESDFEKSFIKKQWALQQLTRKDHHLRRPQRGLPDRSVSVLRAWMFQNFLHPYPKDVDKHLLAIQTGLTRSQVSNWFINARVRLWKPLIEKMYAEFNRGKGLPNAVVANINCRSQINIES
ncbi:hypothetical protein Nepgr_012619 [Nepenthes gracilis]|uniref:Homeobox domain-containing protein n=1 Tax=Nepenthes gracilis TaxID=150966 RepID=A0AAD3SGB5_NEPGR|nr:hypothetical protein Nepgr_012619 [Nepenthes gracilis]